MKAGELLKALSPSNPPFNLMFLAGNSAAVLTVSSFGESPDYEGFLKNAFTQLRERRVTNLIIDLRNNGGGEDRNSMLLCSYIAKAPFRYYTSLISNSDHFEAARNDADFPAEAFRKRAIPAPGGRFQVRESAHPGLRLQQPLPLAFQGNVYCLVNGLTGSAASEFSAVAYSAGLASFIGEETGGGYLFDTSGPQVHVELPNTKVRVVIPTVRYNLAVKPEFQHHGLIPAEKVLPTLENIITSHDVVLQRALGLIQQSQAQRAKVH
jgi:C-terminal processing protease CtpA/Prc